MVCASGLACQARMAGVLARTEQASVYWLQRMQTSAGSVLRRYPATMRFRSGDGSLSEPEYLAI